jgi:hypothetical protein
MDSGSDPIVRLTPFSHFFMEFGQLLGAWNTFEAMVEVVIMRELRLSVEETCIVCGGLNFSSKVGIAHSLLNRTAEGKQKSSAINSAHTLAERNGFAHGIISVNEESNLFTVVRRDVKAKLSVHTKPLKSTDMQKHGHSFYAKFEEAMQICGITDHDLIVYQREIESFAQAPQSPVKPHRESPPSFRSAKQERRHKLRAQRKAEKAQDKG